MPETPPTPVPKVQQTAPKRIYLCVSDEEEHYDEPFPEGHGDDLCWCQDPATACVVPYVRLDVADAERAHWKQAACDADTGRINAEAERHALAERVAELQAENAGLERANELLGGLQTEAEARLASLTQLHKTECDMLRAELGETCKALEASESRLATLTVENALLHERAAEALRLLESVGMGKPGRANCHIDMVREICDSYRTLTSAAKRLAEAWELMYVNTPPPCRYPFHEQGDAAARLIEKPPIEVHSKSQYKRLVAQGAIKESGGAALSTSASPLKGGDK